MSHRRSGPQSIGSMKKELISAGVEIDQDTDIAQEYSQLILKRSQTQQQQGHTSQPLNYPSEHSTGDRQPSRNSSNPRLINNNNNNNSSLRDNHSQQYQLRFQTPEPTLIDHRQAPQSDFWGRTPSNITKGPQNTNNFPSKHERLLPKRQQEEEEEIQNQHNPNEEKKRSSLLDFFNFKRFSNNTNDSQAQNKTDNSQRTSLISPQQARPTSQNQRISSSSASSLNQNARLNNQNQHQRSISPQRTTTSFLTRTNNELIIPNDNSSRRVSNSSVFQSRLSASSSHNPRNVSPNANYSRSAENTLYSSRILRGTPNGEQQFTRTTSFCSSDQKPFDRSLLDTARALSQSKQQRNQSNRGVFGSSQSQQNVLFSSLRGGINDLFNNSQVGSGRSSQLSFQDKVTILVSKIEISHIIMSLMAFLFVFFFVQNVWEYLTYKPILGFCDSTMRPEAVENSSSICLPCPTHAICLKGHIQCNPSYILVNRKCIANPQIETNTLLYIQTVSKQLKQLQAQYYCYDENSSGSGSTFTSPYREHTWEAIDAILLSTHGTDTLFYETLAKAKQYLASKSIREQFEIQFDAYKDTFFVTIFTPSYYCRARLWLIQNSNTLLTILLVIVILFVLIQLRVVKRFIVFMRTNKEMNSREQAMGQQQEIGNHESNYENYQHANELNRENRNQGDHRQDWNQPTKQIQSVMYDANPMQNNNHYYPRQTAMN